MMKKMYCNPMFDRELYSKCLNKMGVDNEICEDGILINIDQYKANYKPAYVPHFIYLNHAYVKKLY